MGRKTRRGRSPLRHHDEERPSRHRPHHTRNGRVKTGYMSETEALVVAREQRQGQGVDLIAYQCSECGAWHLANDNGEF